MRIVADARELEFTRLLEEPVPPFGRVDDAEDCTHALGQRLAETLRAHLGIQHDHGAPLPVDIGLERTEVPAAQNAEKAWPAGRGWPGLRIDGHESILSAGGFVVHSSSD